MPLRVHKQKIAEVPVAVDLGILGRVIGFGDVGGVQQPSQEQPLGDLDEFVDAVAVGNDGFEPGPAVVELKYLLALALGADAVAIGTGAMVAMGCVVCLRCHEGKCPFGIGTQDPELRAKLDIDEAAQKVANYIQAMTYEAVILAKAAGKTKLHSMEREDLRSLTIEACAMTGIPLVGSNYTFGEMFGFC